MGKLTRHSTPSPAPGSSTTNSIVAKADFLFVAAILQGGEGGQRFRKKDSHSEALRAAAELYEHRDFVAAYECFKPICDRVVSDMQRVLARNAEFEANKLATNQQIPLAAAKERVQHLKAHAQQVLDQLTRLLQDLEHKPLVRLHIKKAGSAASTAPPPAEETLSARSDIARETQIDPPASASSGVAIAGHGYAKHAYAPPQPGTIYSIRDKTKGERIVRVISVSPDGTLAHVEIFDDAGPTGRTVQLAVESLARQAERGWCSRLLPVAESEPVPVARDETATEIAANTTMRLDVQNFSRCCADITRANIKFDTQLIKDVADGPFRAANYGQSFLMIEQFTPGFNSAVANSRRAIADGRRALTAQKGNLSGKEIQERTAAFVRSEQLINTAERSFSAILEGLRMYLRAQG